MNDFFPADTIRAEIERLKRIRARIKRGEVFYRVPVSKFPPPPLPKP